VLFCAVADIVWNTTPRFPLGKWETGMAEIVTDRGQARVATFRRRFLKRDLALVLLLALLVAASADWLMHRHVALPATGFAERTLGVAQDGAEHAIYIGGILLERNRHIVAGAALGCFAGAGLGAGAAAIVGVFTAGAGFAAIPAAAAAGCGLLGFSGGAMGWPLDDYLSF
jgi:hypothetical protein